MNTWQRLQTAQQPQEVSKAALLSWALIVVAALLSCLVLVVNGQARRGEVLPEQFFLATHGVPRATAHRPLQVAQAASPLASLSRAATR